MARRLGRKLNLQNILGNQKDPNTSTNTSINTNINANTSINTSSYVKNLPISSDLESNLKICQNTFENDSDVNIRQFSIGKMKKQAFILNIEGISDKTTINENILGILMTDLRKINPDYEINIASLKENALSVYKAVILDSFEKVFDAVVSGNTVIFVEGDSIALEIATRAWEHRNVESPQTENVVRGPHEGFIETLRTNTALVRRKIQNTDLKMEKLKIGHRTHTEVCITYIKGIANDKIVEEVRQRLNSIDIDAVLDSGYIEEFIEDAPSSMFSTIGNTEKPDKLAAKLLEGRVGIIVDGSPMALTVPYLFIESLQDTEDYYSRSYLTSAIRILRFVSLHLTLFLPALYVALATFHPNVVPRKLLLTMQSSHEGTPFPAVIEALFMGSVFEILREAGVRMPRPVGQAVSIVGALVLGDVAVNAGLVSPLLVIIIALTGIMSFLLPPHVSTITLLRYPIIVIGSIMGLFGVIWAYVLLIIHICSLRSFGSPYLSPISPLSLQGLKDFLIRAPWWMLRERPQSITWKKSERIAADLKPGPDK